MRHLNQWNAILTIAVLLVVLSGWVLSGSHTADAFPSRGPAPRTPATSPAVPPSSEPAPSHLSRHPARDSEFTVYHNPDYGVSFRYPRNYALVEGSDTDDLTLLRYQEELAAAEPGAVPVATVVIPEDAYPNTSFRSGALEFVVHPNVTLDACRSSISARSEGLTGTLAIQGIPFDWRLSREEAAGTYVERAAYAGFSRGACYEFVLEVVASDNHEPDSVVKPADLSKILRPLEKIVQSFELHPATAQKK